MKYIILLAGILFCLIRIAQGIRERQEQRQRVEAEKAREADAARLREEWRREQVQYKANLLRIQTLEKEQALARKEREEARKQRERLLKEQERQRREQDRQRREQERQAKEQERQAAILERHEEQLMKLDHRLASAESEIAFNREQIERLFKLQEMELTERDACTYGSSEWQKHERKVITLEGQIHTLQKRIDRAKADKRFCESKMA